MPRPSRRQFLGMTATVPLAATGALTLGAGTAHAADSAYVMGYFTESPDMLAANYGLHLAVSTDGLNWTPLNQNNPVVTPTAGAGGLRDPFILRKQNGTFVVLATDLKGTDWTYNSQYIHVWDSTDLRSFTGYRRLKLHDMVTHSWAPEAYWDASRGQYGVIYSSVNSSGHNVIMVNYTGDFVTASAPQVFFDPGYDVIDGDLAIGVNGVNYLYYKRNSTLVGARSTSLNPGSFTPFSTPVSHGGTEAPTLVKSLTSGSTWYLWGDTWSPNGVFYAWQSNDLAAGTWTALDQKTYTQPLNSKHLTIHPITTTEYTNLLTKWGTPTWNRLKSYNFPARYVRHADYVGRIDPYAFDPYTDSLWKLVPGLADGAGVSFQSVSHPTRYLRHYSYAVRLDENDGTPAFAGDATFYRTAGLADSAWSSFRSYNNPTRYLRHTNYVLRIDPVSTATERQDATFRVGY
ncbi:alpha-L-arabinofuranosidase B [Streptomyces lincolnensis]|uniref:Alpha-L-arabinofuranosidase B n=1 Tax=Streptomyces lincolnensis TaxID=1915 RepID=A0A1B1MJG5_STRLN|nr:glycoside hydrolase family 43 protein [Streptomyces lincolnensis]ANS68739.1 alpha-L-arabinofuranosidase B [Streptomyces lincolnensis]AXG53055.1 alpha-L-arabinofuranosidase B [Streptomyces lincolnensis]QMV10344.1 alpha-L-arabinofuranosidase [Streptomyces lincolnensis]